MKEINEKIKVHDKRTGSTSNRIERVFVDEDGKKYLNLNGKFTSNGVENWFYNLENFETENEIVIIPEFLPVPDCKLKNKDVKNLI